MERHLASSSSRVDVSEDEEGERSSEKPQGFDTNTVEH